MLVALRLSGSLWFVIVACSERIFIASPGLRGIVAGERSMLERPICSRSQTLTPPVPNNAFASFRSLVVVALCKPPVNRSEQFGRLLRLALVTPEACEADGGAEFRGFGLLFGGQS